MSYFLSPLIRQRFFDDATGAPLAGGLLYTYLAGTTTPQTTYSNSTGTTNSNPVVLDSNGYADVWLDPSLSYKFVLQDSNNTVLWTMDNVSFPFEVNTWSSAISYSQGDIVQDSTGYGLFYVSLGDNNLNNPLATSVAKWRRLGGNIRTVSTNTTILATDELVRSNSTSGNLTHTLPACSTTSIGTKIAVKDVGTGGNYTQIKGNGTDTIDGSNTWATNLSSQVQVTFENNGTSWDSNFVVPDSSITSSKMSSNVNMPGKSVQEGGQNIVVSNTNATNSLAIVRGLIASNGGITSGEGFTVNHSGTGEYDITFSTSFSDLPVVVATPSGANGYFNVQGLSTSGCILRFATGTIASPTAADSPFHFIAIGQRA